MKREYQVDLSIDVMGCDGIKTIRVYASSPEEAREEAYEKIQSNISILGVKEVK